MEVMDVANYIINRETDKGRDVTNLRVQRLLYFCYAWVLLKTGEKLFEEPMKAESFGPVVPTVYEKYQRFSASVLPYMPETGNKSSIFSAEIQGYIDEILDECAEFSTDELMDKIASQRPWVDAHNNYYNDIITDKSIIAYHRG